MYFFLLFVLLLSFNCARVWFWAARGRLEGKQDPANSSGMLTGTSPCPAGPAAAGGQLMVQPPFSLKGFLSSGMPLSSGSSPDMDSMYSLISLPVLETCQGTRHSQSGAGSSPHQPLRAAGRGEPRPGTSHPQRGVPKPSLGCPKASQECPKASPGCHGHLSRCGAGAPGPWNVGLEGNCLPGGQRGSAGAPAWVWGLISG